MSANDKWVNPILAEIEEKQDELFTLIRNAKRHSINAWDDVNYKNFHYQIRNTANWLLFESNELLEHMPIHGMAKVKIVPVDNACTQ